MEYSLVFMTAEGEAMVLLSSAISPQLFPALALKVAALQEYIPNLRLVTMNHEVTTLVFEHRNVRLQGEPVRFFQGIDS
jgi:hypothetical protein